MDLLLIATFFVAFLSSLISGMSGGGGGFVMTPYFLFAGLSPQQTIATGSVLTLGLGGGSLWAMRGKQLIARRYFWPLLGLTLIANVAGLAILPHIGGDFFNKAIGLLLIVLSGTLFINKKSFQPGARSSRAIRLGYALYAVLLFANALFASGIGALLFIPLMFLMGLNALETAATKRTLGLVQGAMLFFVLAPQGLVVWDHALIGIIGAWAGAHIGTKIALKKGNEFVKFALALLMIGSGIALLWR